MDATQAIDWDVGDEAADDDQADAVEVGSLSVSHPDGTAELHRLYTGQNIVARRGSERQKDDERLERWREQYSGRDKMNGTFLESSSISSPHAIIFLEKGGELCFVKDLGSKNKTILEIPGKRRQLVNPGDRWSVSSGDTLIFGNARCQVDVHPAAARADQGADMGMPAEEQRAGTLNQAETQAYMSFGEPTEEGGTLEGAEGGPAAAASKTAAAAAAAAGEEAAGRSGAVAEQATLVEPTQVEMQQATQLQTSPNPGEPAIGGPPFAAEGGPNRSPTRAMGGPDVGAAGVPSRSPTRSRTTRDGNLGDDYDEGDSIWLPPLTGAVASQQEVMSPPKEDTLPARLAAATAAPAAAGPTQLPMEPFRAVPHPELQETQLAEPSLGQEFPTQDAQVPIPAAAPAAGGYPPAGGATQAEPSSSGGGGSGLSLRPILPGSTEPGTPRIGAGTQEETTALEPDSEEGTLQIAPSRRPGRVARVLADTQDTLGQAIEPVAAPEQAREAAAPDRAMDAAAPRQAAGAATPEQANRTAAPQEATDPADQITEAAAPEQAADAAAPEQGPDAAAPEQANDAAASEEAPDAAAPEQATNAAALEQAPDATAPEQATKAAAPEQAADAAAPEQATSMAAAAEIGSGGWRVKKKPAAPAHNAPADAPPAQHGSEQSGLPQESTDGDVDFKAHVEKKAILSPRQEYIPSAQQAQLQASSSGWKRKGASTSQNPSQSSEPMPILLPASPPAVAAAVAAAASPSVEEGPSSAGDPSEPQQAAVPDRAAVEERTPARPLWQDLLSDILPGENGGIESDRVLPQPSAGDTGPHDGAQPPEAKVPEEREALHTGAATPGTARRGARRLPASVRAAGQATIPEEPGPSAAAGIKPTPDPKATGADDTEPGSQRVAPADEAHAAAAEEASARPRTARIRPRSARGRCRGPAAAAAADAAPDQAPAAAEAAPNQAAVAADAAPNQAAAAVEAAPDQAATGVDQASTGEGALDQAAAHGAAPDQATPAEAAPEGAVPAGRTAPEEAAAGKALPKHGRGKAARTAAAAADQPDTGDAAGAFAPSTEAADLFADQLDEPAQEARPSSAVQKVFSRRGRRSSAAAAVEEAAQGTMEAALEADVDPEVAPEKKQKRAAPKGRGKKADTAAKQDNVVEAHIAQAAVADTKTAAMTRKVASSKDATGGLTESQTAAQTLAQVRAAQVQAPRISLMPEEAAPATTGRTRGRGNAAKPQAAKCGRAGRDTLAAAAEEKAEQAAAEGGPAGPRGMKRGRGQKQGADDGAVGLGDDLAAEVADAAQPDKRGRTSAAAAAKRSASAELQGPDSAEDDKKKSALGHKGRALARKEEAQAALAPAGKRKRPSKAPPEAEAEISEKDLHASAVEGREAAQTDAQQGGNKQPASDAGATVALAPPVPAARRGRASAAAAAAAAETPAEEAGEQPSASKKRGSKKRPMSEVAAPPEAAATGEHTEEEQATQAAIAPSKKRGRQPPSQAPSEAARKATEALQLPKAKGRAARPGPTRTSAAANEVEAAQETVPALKRSRKSAAKEAAKGSQAEEAVRAQEAHPEVTAAASGAAGPAPKRGRKSAAAAAATGAASQAAEAGPSMQLRGTDAKPPRVLISTCVDAKLRQSITKTVERLGGTITASAQDFTVFVTLDASGGDKDRGFTKSLNALSALASGSPIVSEKWVDACGRSDAFVNAREFLLKDPAAERKFGFSLAAAYEAAQQSLLLEGVHVFLSPGLVAAEADKGEGLRMLVQRAGGNVAETVPKKLPASGAQWLLLGDEKSRVKEAAWAKKALKEKGVKVHGRSALINGLMTQRLDRDADVLLET